MIIVKNDPFVLKNLLLSLPTANLHTLAVLIVHLKRLCSTKLNLMDPSNVAKIFAPTLVPIESGNDDTDLYKHVEHAKKVNIHLIF